MQHRLADLASNVHPSIGAAGQQSHTGLQARRCFLRSCYYLVERRAGKVYRQGLFPRRSRCRFWIAFRDDIRGGHEIVNASQSDQQQERQRLGR